MKHPIKWGDRKVVGVDSLFPWNNAPNTPHRPRYTWNEVFILRSAVGDITNEPWEQWGEEKKKKLIKIILKCQGKTYKESKYVNDYKIKVSDVKLAAEKVLGIEVITENIKF